MPRINIEEKWWGDPRRSRLNTALGFGTGDGAFFISARAAQNFNGEAFDARKILPPAWINALIECGLAEGSPEHLYISGSKEHHQWLVRLREAGSIGGRASASKRSTNAQATVEQPSSIRQPSSSSSSSRTLEHNVRLKSDLAFSEVFDKAKAVIEGLNQITGKSYPLSKTSLKDITARLKEPDPPSVDEILLMIRHRHSKWRDNPDMRQYLRPSTLFNSAKFESYVVEMRVARAEQEQNVLQFG